ncbi:MAG: hypothetical protein MJA31_00670 [Clostridia bacterium]|nr:hypothetical protein [Clostridia bacterium]
MMVLKVLGNEELSAKELMSRVRLKHMPNFRKNYLLPAPKLGFIEITVPNQPRSKNQRYRRI